MSPENNADLSELGRSLADLKEDKVKESVDQLLRAGKPPLEIIAALSAGMDEVGKRYKDGEYFLSELVFSGEIFKEAVAKIRPLLTQSGSTCAADRLIIGTVKGDIHDLGKNIVITLLESAGFEVIDLGVDVPPEKFVEALKNSPGSRLVGLSALLTTAFPSMEATIKAIHEGGYRDRVKIMIGGGSVSQKLTEMMGADFYGRDATEAVDIARKVLKNL